MENFWRVLVGKFFTKNLTKGSAGFFPLSYPEGLSCTQNAWQVLGFSFT
jgi:hypothetical protein